MIRLKRAYDPPSDDDGYRVLVERLWPRGVKKPALKLDAWAKDLSPSPELRRWYGHDQEKWTEFQTRYRAELGSSPAREAVADLARRHANGTITLVFAAKDPDHSSATVLRDYLLRRK